MHIDIDTDEQVMTVDGLRVSLEVLRTIADPDPACFYRFWRDDDTVMIEAYDVEQLVGGET